MTHWISYSKFHGVIEYWKFQGFSDYSKSHGISNSIDKNIYMKKYRQKNMNKLKEKVFCSICNVYYQKYNKDHHFKTKNIVHQLL